MRRLWLPQWDPTYRWAGAKVLRERWQTHIDAAQARRTGRRRAPRRRRPRQIALVSGP